ncbi:hypothetical protein QBA57_28565 [Streptomyces scabiei]|uniref:hypothetical protein n=1 Tax=Streptomyces scabiei TaxID=1930 RepID=UPI001B31CAC7|nr:MULTISPECIES: hypothetical protein [Streptomyces]MBP5883177.1 hypothetical protein [Streptomyces sp. LBUM 1487]MDX2626818.1 hypothetical protein [Streptomyces scabiei]MDX3162755.1 hypothetical protein [Streptomyces scabiei]
MTPRKTVQGEESWDEFWAEVSQGRTETIRGVPVAVPTDMPMIVTKRVEELQDSSALEDVQELIGLLFGAGVLERWIEAGMGLREFQVVMTWGMAHASGNPLTHREAYDLVEQGAGMGKQLAPPGPNRAARRSQSAAGGGRSKRTSSASTATSRKTSRA